MPAVVAEDGERREGVSLLDDMVREGARRMSTAALEAEVDAYLAESAAERDERGRRLTVDAPHLVTPVRAGARFECGVLVERQPAVAA